MLANSVKTLCEALIILSDTVNLGIKKLNSDRIVIDLWLKALTRHPQILCEDIR